MGPQWPAPRRGVSRVVALAAVLGLVVAIVGTAVAVLLPDRPTATAVLALRPRVEAGIGVVDAQLIAQEYAVYLDAAAADVITAAELADPDAAEVTVAVDAETATVRVQASSDTTADAVALANALGDQGVLRSEDDELVAVSLIAPADPAEVDDRPRALYVAASLVTGLLLAGAVLYVGRAREDR